MDMLADSDLVEAAGDFQFLLGRGYPREDALRLVGNRYDFDSDRRHILARGVYSRRDSRDRRRKLVCVSDLRGSSLAVDGHNVLITVESALKGRVVVHTTDGFMRDVAGISGKYRDTSITRKALQLIFEMLTTHKPRHVEFLFDAPMSRSGELAAEVKTLMEKCGLEGNSHAIRVPEVVLNTWKDIVATSDSVIVDHVSSVVDLAGAIITGKINGARIVSLEGGCMSKGGV
jgi:hypothetical protein